MTNEEAKREAIKKLIPDYEKFNSDTKLHRLKITGIMNNNGWIRIERDGSNLPEIGKYKWITKNGVVYEEGFNPNDVGHVEIVMNGCTHYKSITPELPPIY